MSFEHEQEKYLPYTMGAEIQRRFLRTIRGLTQGRRRVNAKVSVSEMPSSERQHLSSKKWKYNITVEFDRQLPSLSWRRFGFLNELLLLAEDDNLLFGVYFLVVKTDHPERFDQYELASAICNVFDWVLGDCTVDPLSVVGRPG